LAQDGCKLTAYTHGVAVTLVAVASEYGHVAEKLAPLRIAAYAAFR
jgi:hypothetical protein